MLLAWSTCRRCTRTASGACQAQTPHALALHATLATPVGGLETDVCLTSDGRLALLHDPWLSIGTTGFGWAHETPWSEIRDLRLRDASARPTAQTPMLLEELFDAAPEGLVIQLDVKTHGDPALGIATATAACRVADRYPAHRVEIISFQATACAAAAELGHRARLIVWADYAPGLARGLGTRRRRARASASSTSCCTPRSSTSCASAG